MRLTVEQDIVFPFIPNDKVEEMSKEPIFQKYLIEAGNLTRGLVSCTGAQVRKWVYVLFTTMQDSGIGVSGYTVRWHAAATPHPLSDELFHLVHMVPHGVLH